MIVGRWLRALTVCSHLSKHGVDAHSASRGIYVIGDVDYVDVLPQPNFGKSEVHHYIVKTCKYA